MSQRHLVWVAENRVKPCNSVRNFYNTSPCLTLTTTTTPRLILYLRLPHVSLCCTKDCQVATRNSLPIYFNLYSSYVGQRL